MTLDIAENKDNSDTDGEVHVRGGHFKEARFEAFGEVCEGMDEFGLVVHP